MRRPGGFTLIELMVGLVIFSLLCALITAVFMMSQRSMRQFQQISLAQRSCGQAMEKIGDELVRAHRETFHQDGDGCWFLSSRPPNGSGTLYASSGDNTGALLWSSYTAIWLDTDRKLQRSQLPVSGGPQTYSEIDGSLSPSALLPFRLSNVRKTIGRDIEAVRIQQVGLEAQVEIVCESQRTPITRYRLQTSFMMQ